MTICSSNSFCWHAKSSSQRVFKPQKQEKKTTEDNGHHMLQHWVLFTSAAICMCAISASLPQHVMIHAVKHTDKKTRKVFKSFPLISVLCSAGSGRAGSWTTNNHYKLSTQRSLFQQDHIMDDLDWGNTNSAVSSETSSFGLARYHFFTLLALKHGQSSVSKTSLCCNQCSWTVRKEAKHKHRSSLRSEAPSFEGCCSFFFCIFPNTRVKSLAQGGQIVPLFQHLISPHVRSLTLVAGAQHVRTLKHTASKTQGFVSTLIVVCWWVIGRTFKCGVWHS